MTNKIKTLLLGFLTGAILLLFLCSCSINKKVTKEKEKEVTNIHAVETTTTTEVTTGIITAVLDSISTATNVDSLFTGREFTSENDNLVTTVSFDKKTKTVKTKTVQKPQTIPVNRTTTAVSQKTTDTGSKKESNVKHKEVESEWFQYWWIVLIVLGLFAIWRVLK